jgi:hypothetical protein
MSSEHTQEHLSINEDMAVVSSEKRKVRNTPLSELRSAVLAARLASYSITEIIQTVTAACEEEPVFIYQGKPHFNLHG